MLLNDFKMNLDDANFHTKLTETQRELVQKFNTAFYEAQNKTPLHQINDDDDDNILDTFDEKYFTNIENYEDAAVADGDGYFFDLILPKVADCANLATPSGDPTNFDYDDFSEKFEQQVQENEPAGASIDDAYVNFDEVFRVKNPSVSTETTSTSRSNEFRYDDGDASPFFVPLPFETKNDEQFENLDLSDIDLSENLSNASLDFDRFDFNCDVKVKLPPVNTIKSNMDFNNILRNSAPNSLLMGQENLKYNSYGHLIGVKSINNNVSTSYVIEDYKEGVISNNHGVMRQNDALMYDDPLLCSGSLLLPKRMRKNTVDSQDSELSTDCEEIYITGQLQCQWENCFQIYDSQGSLVRHIEKCHVELKRGEEFTCFWLNCPRKTKPFNARYKLLIHMRVHSGEKPNKCPFKGCKKAFSRLENLKIHQRSHTGERPYLCQFSNCTKSFSNSSDRAKHQRTHFDTKPYACQVLGCSKKYTDPSSLRKHVKNHTFEEQVQLKKKAECKPKDNVSCPVGRKIETKQKFSATNGEKSVFGPFYTTLDHSYSNSYVTNQYILSAAVKQDLKNKISEKISKEKLIVLS